MWFTFIKLVLWKNKILFWKSLLEGTKNQHNFWTKYDNPGHCASRATSCNLYSSIRDRKLGFLMLHENLLFIVLYSYLFICSQRTNSLWNVFFDCEFWPKLHQLNKLDIELNKLDIDLSEYLGWIGLNWGNFKHVDYWDLKPIFTDLHITFSNTARYMNLWI